MGGYWTKRYFPGGYWSGRHFTRPEPVGTSGMPHLPVVSVIPFRWAEAGHRDFTLYQRTDVTLRGSPRRATNLAAEDTVLTVRDRPDGGGNVVLSRDGLTVDSGNGVVDFRLSRSDLNLSPGVYHYDVRRLDPEVVIAKGKLVLRKAIRGE